MFGLNRHDSDTALARPRNWGGISPWNEFNRLRSEMDAFFDGMLSVPRLFDAPTLTSPFTPAVDLYETKDQIVLNSYLPGISPEDLHVEVVGDVIHVSGETKPTIPEKDATVYVSNGRWGRFDMRYTLPGEVKADEAQATYTNGVLEVRLPKVETQAPKRIEVHVGGQGQPRQLVSGTPEAHNAGETQEAAAAR